MLMSCCRDARWAGGIGCSHSASGCFSMSIAAMLFGPPPPAPNYDVSISVIRLNWTRSRTVINSRPAFSRIVPIHPAWPETGSAK